MTVLILLFISLIIFVYIIKQDVLVTNRGLIYSVTSRDTLEFYNKFRICSLVLAPVDAPVTHIPPLMPALIIIGGINIIMLWRYLLQEFEKEREENNTVIIDLTAFYFYHISSHGTERIRVLIIDRLGPSGKNLIFLQRYSASYPGTNYVYHPEWYPITGYTIYYSDNIKINYVGWATNVNGFESINDRLGVWLPIPFCDSSELTVRGVRVKILAGGEEPIFSVWHTISGPRWYIFVPLDLRPIRFEIDTSSRAFNALTEASRILALINH